MVSYGQKNYLFFDPSYSDQIQYVFLKHISRTGQIKLLHQQCCLSPAYLNPFSLEYSLSRNQDGSWHASSLTQRFFCLLRACLLVIFTVILGKEVCNLLSRGFKSQWFI